MQAQPSNFAGHGDLPSSTKQKLSVTYKYKSGKSGESEVGFLLSISTLEESSRSSVEDSFNPVICITINEQSRGHCMQIGPSARFYWWLRRPLGPTALALNYAATLRTQLWRRRGENGFN